MDSTLSRRTTHAYPQAEVAHRSGVPTTCESVAETVIPQLESAYESTRDKAGPGVRRCSRQGRHPRWPTPATRSDPPSTMLGTRLSRRSPRVGPSRPRRHPPPPPSLRPLPREGGRLEGLRHREGRRAAPRARADGLRSSRSSLFLGGLARHRRRGLQQAAPAVVGQQQLAVVLRADPAARRRPPATTTAPAAAAAEAPDHRGRRWRRPRRGDQPMPPTLRTRSRRRSPRRRSSTSTTCRRTRASRRSRADLPQLNPGAGPAACSRRSRRRSAPTSRRATRSARRDRPGSRRAAPPTSASRAPCPSAARARRRRP